MRGQQDQGACRDYENGVYSGPQATVPWDRSEVVRVNDFSHIDDKGKVKMVDVSETIWLELL